MPSTKVQRIVVWFRQDLRMSDNEALHLAIERGLEVIPIYVFDERTFSGQTKFGFRKTEKFRAQFIIESIQDLRNSFKKLGINLVVRVGKPEEEVFELAKQVESSWVFTNMERMDEEVKVQNKLEQKLWSIGQELHFFRGKMLYYTQDLPFPISQSPDVFSTFRKEVEKYIVIREPLARPEEKLSPWTIRVELGKMPQLNDLNYDSIQVPQMKAFAFKGGETEGLARLHYYLWETDLIKNYKETRNDLLGGDFSSRLSPWLAQGCLSPKTVYFELKRYEKERKSNKSTYWLFFELLWRDFFRLMGKKHGNDIFKEGGLIEQPITGLSNDERLFTIWAEGRTGVPFIDANMRELNQTGFMSNRGRQNVASFLVKDLKVNWLLGAEYFESMLIDYDVCSNYGNWNYVAGVGNDPRENRYYNILAQAKRYDPEGLYVKHWLPELSDLPVEKIHRPDMLSVEEQGELSMRLGAEYPKSVINMERWT